jgi:hypothetical protein
MAASKRLLLTAIIAVCVNLFCFPWPSSSEETASCPDSDGSRPCYHVPGPNDLYLSNCNNNNNNNNNNNDNNDNENNSNPLKREYWRIFQKQDGTAYMIPRPDGLGVKYQICSDVVTTQTTQATKGKSIETINNKANQYGLCNDQQQQQQQNTLAVNVINSMNSNDALEFSTIFHRQLKFTQVGNSIDPSAFHDDIIAACKNILEEENTQAHSYTYCHEVKNKCCEAGHCIESISNPSQAAMDELIPALNNLYGVMDIGDTCNIKEWGNTFGCPVAKCMAPPSGCSYKFDSYVINASGDCCARMCYAVDANGDECGFDDTSAGESSSLLTNRKKNLNQQNQHHSDTKRIATINIGDTCNPTETETEQVDPFAFGCPVASCTVPPLGCSYISDSYVINSSGDCCARMCYAVDANGNECSFDDTSVGVRVVPYMFWVSLVVFLLLNK